MFSLKNLAKMKERKTLGNNTIKFIPLEWDTNYFNVKSGRIQLNGNITKAEEIEIYEFIKKYEFITIENVGNNSHNNNWIGKNTNASLTDINIQYKKNILKNPVILDDNLQIFNSLVGDSRLISLAKQSFIHSRFFNDSYISDDLAENIYENWVKNSFNKKEKYFVICENEEVIEGFLLFSYQHKEAIIELIAVDEKMRGKNIGKKLLNKLVSYLITIEVSTVKVGTQVDNISAMRFYSKNNFIIQKASSIYHIWK